jgi:hypothetical protein
MSEFAGWTKDDLTFCLPLVYICFDVPVPFTIRVLRYSLNNNEMGYKEVLVVDRRGTKG